MTNALAKLFTPPKDDEAAVASEIANIQSRLHKATERKNGAAAIIEQRVPAKVAGDKLAADDIAQARADLGAAEQDISELRLAAKAKQAELSAIQARKRDSAMAAKKRIFHKTAEERARRISDISFHMRELARHLSAAHDDAARMRALATEIWGKGKGGHASGHDWPLGHQSVECRLMEFGAHLGLDKALDYFAGSVRNPKGVDFTAWEIEQQNAWIGQFSDPAKDGADQNDGPQAA